MSTSTYLDEAGLSRYNSYIQAQLSNKAIASDVTSDINNAKSEIKNYVLTNYNTKFDILISKHTKNSIVRGKDITSYYTDGSLWYRIAGTNGYSEYDDLYLGDYFKMNSAISAYNNGQGYQTTGSQYVTIADFGGMWGNGDNISMAYNHLVMVPGQGPSSGSYHFGRARMNSSNTTSGGYVGSEMYTSTIGGVVTSTATLSETSSINQQLYNEFGSHLKTTRELLSNATGSGVTRFGTTDYVSTGWSWYSCQAVLMSEIEVYGSTVWSSSGYDSGTANRQLSLFKECKSAINNRSSWYWLKDVASGSFFANVHNYGYAYCYYAAYADYYVRPRFVIA